MTWFFDTLRAVPNGTALCYIEQYNVGRGHDPAADYPEMSGIYYLLR